MNGGWVSVIVVASFGLGMLGGVIADKAAPRPESEIVVTCDDGEQFYRMKNVVAFCAAHPNDALIYSRDAGEGMPNFFCPTIAKEFWGDTPSNDNDQSQQTMTRKQVWDSSNAQLRKVKGWNK